VTKDTEIPFLALFYYLNLDLIKTFFLVSGRCIIDAANHLGETSLMRAAFYDYADIAKRLLKDGMQTQIYPFLSLFTRLNERWAHIHCDNGFFRKITN